MTLPAWDQLTTVLSEEDEVWEMIDVVAAAIMPRSASSAMVKRSR